MNPTAPNQRWQRPRGWQRPATHPSSSDAVRIFLPTFLTGLEQLQPPLPAHAGQLQSSQPWSLAQQRAGPAPGTADQPCPLLTPRRTSTNFSCLQRNLDKVCTPSGLFSKQTSKHANECTASLSSTAPFVPALGPVGLPGTYVCVPPRVPRPRRPRIALSTSISIEVSVLRVVSALQDVALKIPDTLHPKIPNAPQGHRSAGRLTRPPLPPAAH